MSLVKLGNIEMKHLAILAIFMSSVGIANAASSEDCESIYMDAARLSKIRISRKSWEVGQIVSPVTTRSSASSGLLLETVAQPVMDCSNRDYRCLRSWTHTLAIPRSGLKAHASYQKDQVTFVVEDCLLLEGEACSVALVSARCQIVNIDGTCAPSKTGNPSATKFENVDYLIYHQDFGITAFGSTDHLLATPDQRLAVASRFFLNSKSGMFGPTTACKSGK
jgi:hypothetical protein